MRSAFKELIILILKNCYMDFYASWIHQKYKYSGIENIKPRLDAMHRKLYGFGLEE